MMIKSFTIVVFINLFLLTSLYANFNSKIIVKVENEIITNYELKNKILTTLILSNQEINQKKIDELKKIILDQLIHLKLKKIELEKFKVEKDERRINSYLNSISNNNIEAFKKKFVENNINYDLYLDELDIELRWQRLIYSLYAKKITVNENTLDKEIEQIISTRSEVEEFELSEIEINIESVNQPEKKIEEILNKIKSDGFEEVALSYSTSSTSSQKGYLGWVNGKALSREIYKIVSELKLGQTSNPIKKQNSVLFLKLIDKKKMNAEKLDKNKLKNTIIERKKNDLFNLYSQSRLSVLRSNSFIQY